MSDSIVVRAATAEDLQTVFHFICQLENDTFDLDEFHRVYENLQEES